jgi:flagellar basal-body rod modification protein FlgD
MASIGTTLPTSTTGATTATGGASSTSSSGTSSASSAATDPLANEGTFLQLLVAQLKNQDPSQPMDGTTFVTQLAQFSTLEQELASRKDLDAISTDLSSTSAASGTTAASGTGTTGSSGSSSTTGTTDTTGTTSTTSTSGA